MGSPKVWINDQIGHDESMSQREPSPPSMTITRIGGSVLWSSKVDPLATLSYNLRGTHLSYHHVIAKDGPLQDAHQLTTNIIGLSLYICELLIFATSLHFIRLIIFPTQSAQQRKKHMSCSFRRRGSDMIYNIHAMTLESLHEIKTDDRASQWHALLLSSQVNQIESRGTIHAKPRNAPNAIAPG